MAHVFGSSWVVRLLVSITVVLLQSQMVQGNGAELQRQVLDKCKEIVLDSDRCNSFWKLFTAAFVGKDPETIKPAAYDPLIQLEPIREDGKEILLYSKTIDMIRQLKNKKHFLNIWETIYGSLDVPFAEWCGKKGSQVIYTSGCPGNARDPYWTSASVAFAKAATRVATVLLNGTVWEPYDKDSFFATAEVPNLSDKVTLRVILVRKDSSKKNCDNESLQRLKRELKGKYECRTATDLELKATEPQKWWDTAKP